MFRYIIPFILAGGKSLRMGLSKSFLYVNGIFFIEHILYLFFDMGFLFIYISGGFFKYSIVDDINYSTGPISSFYSIILNNKILYFFHIFLIPVDMPFLEKNNFLYLILLSKKNVSYCSSIFLFPILLSLSYNLFFCLYFFSINNIKKGVFFLLKIIFVKKVLNNIFCYNNFSNINIFMDLFLKK